MTLYSLEIQSPGILPFGMTIDDFKSGISKIRNRVITRSFKEIGLMKGWGSGYRRIVDFYEENGYPVPEWQEIGPALRVTLYPHPEAKEITPPGYLLSSKNVGFLQKWCRQKNNPRATWYKE